MLGKDRLDESRFSVSVNEALKPTECLLVTNTVPKPDVAYPTVGHKLRLNALVNVLSIPSRHPVDYFPLNL